MILFAPCAKAKGADINTVVVANEMSALQMNDRNISMLTSTIIQLDRGVYS